MALSDQIPPEQLDSAILLLQHLQEMQASHAESQKGIGEKTLDFLKAAGPELKTSGTNFMRGMVGGYTGGLGLLGSAFLPPENELPKQLLGIPHKLFPTPENETASQQFRRAAEEGAGGAVSLGGPMLAGPRLVKGAIPALKETAKALPAFAAGGYTGGAGGEAGRRFAGGITDDPYWKPWLEMGGMLLGGFAGASPVNLITARLAGLSQNPAQRTLRQNAPPVDSPAWREAAQKLRDFRETKVNTGTLAEAFPPEAGPVKLAAEVSGETGGQAIANKVMGREADLTALTNRTLNKVGPEVPAEKVTARAQHAADLYIERLGQARGNAYRALLNKAPELDPTAMRLVYDSLISLAKKTEGQAEKAALEQVAAGLLQANKTSVPVPPTIRPDGTIKFNDPVDVNLPKTSLDKALVDVKDVQGRTMTSSDIGGAKLNSAEYRKAYQLAVDALKILTPTLPNGKRLLQQAEENFATFTRKAVEPAQRGALGQLVGNIDSPTPPATRLRALITDQGPRDIQKNIARMEWASGDPNLGRDIARELLAQKVANDPTNFGRSVRGVEGSRNERTMQAMLDAVGGPTQEVTQAARVADALQGLREAVKAPRTQMNPLTSFLLRPFRAADLRLSGMNQEMRNRQIAEMLSDPAAFERLREIAMFDPAARRQLEIMTILQRPLQREGEK